MYKYTYSQDAIYAHESTWTSVGWVGYQGPSDWKLLKMETKEIEITENGGDVK